MRNSIATSNELRFWAKVDKSGDCWEWTASKDRDGYGKFKIDRRMRQAHCIAYEFDNGPIPQGLEVDHECRNRGCVKPAHLRALTKKQNLENFAGVYANNKSGVRGVHWNAQKNRWIASVGHNGSVVRAGSFTSLADAEVAVIAKRLELHTHNEIDRLAA